jgi:hypothetical protein
LIDFEQLSLDTKIPESSLRDQYKFVYGDNGLSQLRLSSPCTMNNGVFNIDLISNQLSSINEEWKDLDIFIPASGSATRLFELSDNIKTLNENIDKLPFFDKKSVSHLVDKYSHKPKAIVPFHKIEGHIVSPIEEIIEFYSRIFPDSNVHFTIQDDDENLITTKLNESDFIKSKKIKFEDKVRFSFQKKELNSICFINPETLLKHNNKYYSHPSGHGALIDNLASIKSKYAYMHNIDNVSPKTQELRIKNINQMYKLLLFIDKNIKKLLRALVKDDFQRVIESSFYKNFLIEYFPHLVHVRNEPVNKKILFKNLNKPIRVCGVIHDSGAKGGKPFWVYDDDSLLSLQIVEESQVDLDNSRERNIWYDSNYFNPVEIIISTEDYLGNKFNFNSYVNKDLGMVVEKKIHNEKVLFFEKPGLWNGSMHDWITIFVEIDEKSFAPVKNICDLFLPIHQP